MLTPQEIQDKKFEKAMFGGYDMEQIDKFLDEVLDDYTSLYKENAALKAKMRVLVDKIEEYRTVDEDMRKALYLAQKTAKETVENAQEEAKKILSGAQSKARQNVAGMQEEQEKEETKLREAKRVSAEYAAKIKGLLQDNIRIGEEIMAGSYQPPEAKAEVHKNSAESFEINLPEEVTADGPFPAAPEKEEEDTKRIIQPERAEPGAGDKMETKYFEIDLEKSHSRREEPDRDYEEKSDTGKIYGDGTRTPKPRFDFSDLRFGKNFKEEADDDN